MATGIIKKSLDMKIQSVTLPFTPPSNGLLFCEIRAGSAGGRFYVTYSGPLPAIIDSYNVGNGYVVGTLFVTKGVTVSVTGSSNVVTQSYRFVSLS